jgi:hypothetical protein
LSQFEPNGSKFLETKVQVGDRFAVIASWQVRGAIGSRKLDALRVGDGGVVVSLESDNSLRRGKPLRMGQRLREVKDRRHRLSLGSALTMTVPSARFLDQFAISATFAEVSGDEEDAAAGLRKVMA